MLQLTVDWFFYSLLGMIRESALAAALNFFVYDSIKILFLLFVMIAVIGFLRTFLPQDKVKEWAGRGHFGTANFLAALFGAATPFCSCSSIPIFLSFLKAGMPLGVAFSFLITSPLVNEYLVVIMLGFFGWKITLVYVVSGIFLGVGVGILLGRMKLEKYLVKDFMSDEDVGTATIECKNFGQRIFFGLTEAKGIVRKIWIWVLVGVGVGAVIHNYVPQEWIHTVISRGGYWTVPVATILGVQLYGSCAAIVPIAVVLFKKGIPLGTALAFMMAIAGLSLPEAIILRRAMRLQLILSFFAIVTLAIILTGYAFNALQQVLF